MSTVSLECPRPNPNPALSRTSPNRIRNRIGNRNPRADPYSDPLRRIPSNPNPKPNPRPKPDPKPNLFLFFGRRSSCLNFWCTFTRMGTRVLSSSPRLIERLRSNSSDIGRLVTAARWK